MATERALDRLVFFTDAVAAIAITLLILPLVDEVPAAAARGHSVEQFLDENVSQITAFAISFAVIARLWMAHHTLFQHVRAHTPPLIWLNLLWSLTIVVLPLPTAVVSEFVVDRAAVAFYVGTMAASSSVLTLIVVVILRSPGVVDPSSPVETRALRGSVINSALFVLALIVGVLSSTIGLWALLALFLTGPLERFVSLAIARRTG